MNISKFKVVLKLINPFGGFASAFEYVVGCLNTWLASVNVAANVAKTLSVARTVYGLVVWLGRFCPAKWSVAYASTCKAVETYVANGGTKDKMLADMLKVCDILCPGHGGYEPKCENCKCKLLCDKHHSLQLEISEYRETIESGKARSAS